MEDKKYDVVIKKFNEDFLPKRNVIHELACFHRRVQKEGEMVEAFIRSLYKLEEHCKCGTKRDEQIRDRIVIGILDKSLSRKLQMKPDLNLDMAIQMARQSEQINIQVAGQTDEKHLGEVSRKDRRRRTSRKLDPKPRDKKQSTSRSTNVVPDATAHTDTTRHARRRTRNVENVKRWDISRWSAVW